jgi:hypothetical protein
MADGPLEEVGTSSIVEEPIETRRTRKRAERRKTAIERAWVIAYRARLNRRNELPQLIKTGIGLDHWSERLAKLLI